MMRRRAAFSTTMRRFGVTAGLLALPSISGTAVANPKAWYIIDGSTFSQLTEGDRSVELQPADETASAWDAEFFTGSGDPHGMWVFADETGKVRTYVRTGNAFDPPGSRWGRAALVWTGEYIRDATPVKFTLNPSWIHVFAQTPGPFELIGPFGNSRWAYGKMEFEVTLCRGGSGRCALIFRSRSMLEGIVPHMLVEYSDVIGVQQLIRGTSVHPFAKYLSEEPTWFETCYSLPERPTCVKLQTGIRYGSKEAYEEQIELDDYGIGIGDRYTIAYRMYVEAGSEHVAEQYAEVILGDPLDAGMGGFTLETSHLPAPGGPAQICSSAADPFRFTINGSTVTDGKTGLIWQRCPVGTALDAHGTPLDPSDDTCPVTPGAELDWQNALAQGAIDTTDGFDDWRVPNIKELESLALDACAFPAIDLAAFPRTDGTSAAYWSSTPAPDADKAWIVDFATGDFSARDRSRDAHVRLVRESLGQPAEPVTRIGVTDAEALEGDSGTTPLAFVVTLSPPPAAPLTLDYSIFPLTATESQDYQVPAGTLAIPAGSASAVIEVPIIGDLETESDEFVELTLDDVVGDAWIGRSSAIGRIRDDDPRPVVSSPVVSEAGGSLEFIVRVPEAVAAPLIIDYETEDGTAMAGADYTGALGSAIVNVGEDRTTITVAIMDDGIWENDETVTLLLTAPGLGTSVPVTGTILDDDGPRTYQALNDTGVDYCATANSALLACPQAGFPSQDGEVGRDVTDPDSSDGLNGFSFTKLDESGVPLADQSLPYSTQPWSCVLDEVTGLIWEIKSGDPADLRFYDWTYTWYDSDGVNDGGDPGTPNGGVCVDTASCDTEKYVAAVNTAGLCGFSDWRVPTIDETYTLARTATPDAFALRGLDQNFFPHNYSTGGQGLEGLSYWSSSTFAQDPGWAWGLLFKSPDSSMNYGPKSERQRVRLVR